MPYPSPALRGVDVDTKTVPSKTTGAKLASYKKQSWQRQPPPQFLNHWAPCGTRRHNFPDYGTHPRG